MHNENQTETTETTASTNTRHAVSFRGRPKPRITVAIPQRRTAEDRALFPEFDGQDKLDAAAAEIAQMVESKVNGRAEKLANVTPYAAEYITARALWLVSRAVA